MNGFLRRNGRCNARGGQQSGEKLQGGRYLLHRKEAARVSLPSPNPFCSEATQTHAAPAPQAAKYYDRCFPVLGKNTCNWTHTFLNTLADFFFLKAHCSLLERAAFQKNLMLTK